MGPCASKKGPESAPTRVLVIGSEAAGKTLLLRQLANLAKRGKPADIETATIQSIGTELRQIIVGKTNVVFREMGGSMNPVWPRFFDECAMVIFVIDCSSEAQLASATIELLTALQSPALEAKPFAIALNKCDLPGQLPAQTIERVLRVDDIVASESAHRPVVLLRCSAKTAAGLADLEKWVVDCAVRRPLTAR
ncbi:P-loop containing nucleoside triphosphate hydrolase protein [Pavlovales sp. CCMP2436]|nr:P-loop containing nucleoside triphosphate hydrolase protein [Pavlovales sp. CCMP2436]|mmetsp:Transcript_11275/g.28502  ORF Transcript_11275/g.28502 Transcript_11275/m.28502 type:complete len:194 (+) Transcript_11275:126-707(+)